MSRSLREFFQLKDGLPESGGPLSASMSSGAILQANKEVSAAKSSRKTCGKYNKFSDELRADIGRYASYHGVAPASRHFTKKLGDKVGESTVRSIRDSYLIEAKRRRVDNVENLDILPHKKRGRPPLLGEALDLKVQQYLRKVRDGGGTVTARIAVAAA